jgi:hypothetical protein
VGECRGAACGPSFSLGSGVSRARTRGSVICGGFLLPVLRRQDSPSGFGFGVGSGLVFIRSIPSRWTIPHLSDGLQN